MAGFGISDVEPLGSATRELVRSYGNMLCGWIWLRIVSSDGPCY